MKLPTVALLVLTATACVEPVDDLGEQSLEIVKDPGDLPDPLPTTPPPPPPPNGPNVLRISSAMLTERMITFLGGTGGPLINVDTTGKSPTKVLAITPHTVCIDPDAEARDQAYALCDEFVGFGRANCLQQVIEDYPVAFECHQQTVDTFHSYLDFNSFAEAAGATDVGIRLAPIEKDTYGPGGVTIDANWIRSSAEQPSASFAPTLGNPEPTAHVWLRLTSSSPTLPCVHSVGGDAACPDIQLTNMRVLLRFPGLGPSTTAGLLTTEAPLATFYFDRNLNGVPDFLVTALVDVDAIIRDAVEGRLLTELRSSRGWAAVNAALTGLALAEVKKVHPTASRITRVRQTWYEAGQMVLAYDWQ